MNITFESIIIGSRYGIALCLSVRLSHMPA